MIETVLTNDKINRFTEMGFWRNKLWTDFIKENADKWPDQEAIVDRKHRITYQQYKAIVDNIAANLTNLGIKKYDRVGLQLPNWWEFVCTRFALHRIGAITLPLYPNMRHREIEYILNKTEAKAYVVPHIFRNFNYVQMADDVKSNLNKLEKLIVINGQSNHSPSWIVNFDSLLEDASNKDLEQLDSIKINPNDVDYIATTSGTTSMPKLVLRSPNQMQGMVFPIAKRWKLKTEDKILGMAPITFGVGYHAVSTSLISGATAVLLEWPIMEEALELIDNEEISVVLGVPTLFIKLEGSQDLIKCKGKHLRCFTSGGAKLPASVAEGLAKHFNCKVICGYGAVDGGIPTWGGPNDPDEKLFTTVGKTLEGMELSVIDDNGNHLPEGESGEIVYRGANCSLGYYNDNETYQKSFNSDGWFYSGDLGTIDQEGYLQIIGRSKEIIIRGGLNISPIEIEELLQTCPKIKQIAVVKMPDKIMGEKACAYVILKEKETFSLDEMNNFLLEKQVPKYKLPERLEIVDNFPTTGSEKISKKDLEKDIINKLKNEGIEWE